MSSIFLGYDRGNGGDTMDIFEYIDSKKNYYESMENEYRLSYKKNQSMIKELSDRLQLLLKKEEESDFERRFAAGKKDEQLELDIKELEKRIEFFKQENEEYQEIIVECVEELRILNDLELPVFGEVQEVAAGAEYMETSSDVDSQRNVNKSVNTDKSVNTENPIELDLDIKNKIQFCSKIALQDPQRCKLELEELIRTFQS